MKDLLESYFNKLQEDIIVEGLSEWDKVQLWHEGKRNVNIKACSEDKLERYYHIAEGKGYTEICNSIIDEARRRGISLAGVPATNVSSTPGPSTQASNTAAQPQGNSCATIPASSGSSSTQDEEEDIAEDEIDVDLDELKPLAGKPKFRTFTSDIEPEEEQDKQVPKISWVPGQSNTSGIKWQPKSNKD